MQIRRRTAFLRTSRRRGAIAALLALLLIPLLAAVAFCVDIGWITKTKSELQTAADASAAAGAAQLADNFSAYSLPTQANRSNLLAAAKANASSYVSQYGQYNGAGEVRSLSILANDVQFGFTNANGDFSANYLGYPNTVQVAVRRDLNANRSLPLFLGAIFGKASESLTASSSATIYTGLINSFDPNGGGERSTSSSSGNAWGDNFTSSASGYKCSMLPVAFDLNMWKAFCATGVSPDGSLNSDSSGSPSIKIYPSPQNAPGNFGLLCIGAWTNATPDYSNWIQNGPSCSDLQYLLSQGELPVSEQSPKAWKGSPGLRNTLRSDFESIIGQPRLLPLFQPAETSPYQAASGTGSNATYQIVGFVGVTVVSVTGNGGNLNISVKPCDLIDPTAVFNPATVYPAGAEPAGQLTTFTHVAPKLTR